MLRRSRIEARPTPVAQPAPLGLLTLEGGLRDSYFYVPASYEFTRPAAFALLLHGSGGHAHHGLEILQPLADEFTVILVAPASGDYAWDLVAGRHAPEVALINGALERVFATYAVDPAHVAIAGFSDGASYALSLGLANSSLFTHVIAFSPGFVPLPHAARGRVFISHGTRDEILPITRCSQRILPQLERRGLATEYVEFEGGHRIAPEIARRAVEWFRESAECAPAGRRHRAPENRPPREG
jgi:phospholipase/carboxylesterase